METRFLLNRVLDNFDGLMIIVWSECHLSKVIEES